MRPDVASRGAYPRKDSMTAATFGPHRNFRRALLGLGSAALLACQTSSETSNPGADAGALTPGAGWDSAVYGFDATVGFPNTSDAGRPDAATALPINPGDTDLPCDVATVMANTCWYCHGKTLSFAAPMPLLNSADFKANGKLTPTQSVGQLTLARIADPAKPMPPTYHPKQLDDASKKLLNDWVAAGMAPRAPTAPACTLPTVEQPGVYDATPVGGPADCTDYYELRGHGKPVVGDTTPFKIPADPGNGGNTYQCFYFDAPYDLEAQGMWFAPIVDNTKVLHHWLLYGADQETAISGAPGTYGPCSAAEPGRYLIAGWAPGAGPTKLPNDVGLHLSKRLVLEVHYYNNTGAEAEDRSGVKFCTAKKDTRPHLAGVHFTGSEGICVDPGQQKEVSGPCDPADNGDIHILNIWPHMHKTGTRMRIVINRRGGGQEVLHDEAFDFNNQVAYPKDVVLHNGDTMETHCTYKNSTNDRVHFGERTQDEMCYGFITAWPNGALQTDPTSTLINPVNWVALPIQPALRCLDPTGIFGSCNGVSDYPF
jgi:hypothetical protein